jgi:integrase
MRPIEVCRLKVKSINLNEKTIQFKAKNGLLKTKIIPELLWNDLPELSVLKKESVLFTPEEFGANWNTEVDNRRDYFSKKFKRVVKDEFNLGEDYGLYSFRHTYITKVYRELRQTASPFEAKSNLMLITGHTSMASLEKYLRDIDAELPEDYSKMLKKTNG